MKTLILFCLLLTACVPVPAQDTTNIGTYCKQHAISWSCLVVAGFSEGFLEELQFNYCAVKRRFNTNDKFFDMNISWRNKYKNGDPKQGEKFFGSTTFLAFTSDGFHLSQMVRNLGLLGAVTLTINGKRRWYLYAMDFAINAVIYDMTNFCTQAIIK